LKKKKEKKGQRGIQIKQLGATAGPKRKEQNVGRKSTAEMYVKNSGGSGIAPQ